MTDQIQALKLIAKGVKMLKKSGGNIVGAIEIDKGKLVINAQNDSFFTEQCMKFIELIHNEIQRHPEVILAEEAHYSVKH